MIKAIIIDDEPDALDVLAITLEENFKDDVKIIAKTNNYREGPLLIKELKPDVIFLDIDLGDNYSGFDLVDEIKGFGLNFRVVFTTAYHQFAIKAVKVQAYDYLLKPVDIDELGNLIKRLAADLSSSNSKPQQYKEGIIVNNNDTLHKLLLEDIIAFEGNGNYTNIFVNGKKTPILSSNTLNSFDEEVTKISSTFFRIHKSYFINLKAVDHLKKKGINRFVVLKNGEKVPISRLRFKDFMDAFMQ